MKVSIVVAVCALFGSAALAQEVPAPPEKEDVVKFSFYSDFLGVTMESESRKGELGLFATFDGTSNVDLMVLDFKRGVPFPDVSSPRSSQTNVEGDLKVSLEKISDSYSKAVANLTTLMEPRAHFFFSRYTNSFGEKSREWQEYVNGLRARYRVVSSLVTNREAFMELPPYLLERESSEWYEFRTTNRIYTKFCMKKFWLGPAPTTTPFLLGTDGTNYFRVSNGEMEK